MAYIPPHKRQSKDTNTLSPSPFPSFLSHLQRNSNAHNSKKQAPSHVRGAHNIVYTTDSIRRWFIVPLDVSNDDDAAELPLSLKMKEFPCELMAFRDYNPKILVCDFHPQYDVHEIMTNFARTPSPLVSVIDKAEDDIRTSFQVARNEMGDNVHAHRLPNVVLRFGKILFHKIPSSICLDNADKISALERILSGYNRTFHTSVPISFIETILSEIVAKVGLEFHKETEYYSLKLINKTKPEESLTCKCTVVKDNGELELHEVELRDVRHLVVDMSCIDRKLDLRLMLSSKRNMTSLNCQERESLRDLIKSAIIDSDVKGGLRWPQQNEFGNDRYDVIGVWHTKAKLFRNSSIMLKVRHADRFDFRTLTGEVADEVSLRMTELNNMLRDLNSELSPMIDMVRDVLKLIWERFLCWEGSFI